MCTTLHNEFAWFDAFKTCQMLYKQKIHNSCRTHETVKALCCYSQQNGVSHTPTASPLSLFLWVTSFASRFSPWCCSSTWPWRPLSWGHRPFLNCWPFLPQQRSLNWQLPFGVGVANWEERKKRRRNHIAVHKLHARQWTRLIHTFFPNAHCTMFRGQWRIQIEQEASWLCVSVRSELTALLSRHTGSNFDYIQKPPTVSGGPQQTPECAQIKAAWPHNENRARLAPNYFLLGLSAPRGGCR